MAYLYYTRREKVCENWLVVETQHFVSRRCPKSLDSAYAGRSTKRHKMLCLFYIVFAMNFVMSITALYLAKFGCQLQGYVAHNFVVLPVIICSVACLSNGPQTVFLRWIGSSLMEYLGRIS